MAKKKSDDVRKIPEPTSKNFDTLVKAVKNGQACIVRARRKSDGAYVTLVCATWKDDEEMVNMAPFAVMTGEDGNPYDQYVPAMDPEFDAEPKKEG